MEKKSLLIFVLSLFYLSQTEEVYKKIVHNTDSEAKCLDGSPGALYIH